MQSFRNMGEGRAQPSAAAQALGWELVDVDPDAGTIEVAFTTGEQFRNQTGHIVNGFLAAMLDATLESAMLASLAADQSAATSDLQVQFLVPSRPGRLIGRGRVVRRSRGVAFLGGELVNPLGELIAVATATAAIHRV